MTQHVAMPERKPGRTCLSRELRAILRRARRRGELRPGTDVELLEEVVLGALLYLVLLEGPSIDAARLRRAVAVILRGAVR